MARLNRFLVLSFSFLILSSLFVLAITPTTVQATSKPSVPQFSLKFFDNSHDVPPYTTTVTDPYTGKETITTHPGHRVGNYHLTVTIKKQAFTPYTDADGHTYNLYFNIQVKGHFEETWKSFASYSSSQPISQSTNGDTEVSSIFTEQSNWGFLTNLSSGAQLDFRVEAYTGYWHDPMPWLHIREPWVERVESSGWSNIQTITITYDSSSTPPSQTATPSSDPTSTSDNSSIPPADFVLSTNFLLGLIALLLCVIVVLVILFIGRQSKISPISTTSMTYPLNSIGSCLRNDSRVCV